MKTKAPSAEAGILPVMKHQAPIFGGFIVTGRRFLEKMFRCRPSSTVRAKEMQQAFAKRAGLFCSESCFLAVDSKTAIVPVIALAFERIASLWNMVERHKPDFAQTHRN